MSIIVFAGTWIATWALCWFGLARAWKSKRQTFGIYWMGHSTTVKGFPRVERGPDGQEWVSLVGGRWRLSGAREWAPLIATVVAFAVDWACA